MSNQIPYKLSCVKGKERWNKWISFARTTPGAAAIPRRSGPAFPAVLHRMHCKWQAAEGNAPTSPGNNGESQGLRRNTCFSQGGRRNPLPVKDKLRIWYFLALLWYAACSLFSTLRGGRRLHEPDPASYHLAAPSLRLPGLFSRAGQGVFFISGRQSGTAGP